MEVSGLIGSATWNISYPATYRKPRNLTSGRVGGMVAANADIGSIHDRRMPERAKRRQAICIHRRSFLFSEMKAVEYWPNFVERSDEPREVEISQISDALNIPWAKEKAQRLGGDLHIERNHIVMAGQWVIALINS